MAERKLERSLQLTGLDIQRASEIWKKLSNEGLEYLSQLGNRTLTAYQQLSTTDFEVSLSKLEAQSNMPPLESLTEQKVQDLLARMRIQLNIMQLAVSKMDTAIQHARPWVIRSITKDTSIEAIYYPGAYWRFID
ncbi:hypothetical protein BASA61_003005 [Batrachochytrium salamandrivorans]|nr:hypothetical protein BASA61_003005 [Batrachochytrium salamandrivorans]